MTTHPAGEDGRLRLIGATDDRDLEPDLDAALPVTVNLGPIRQGSRESTVLIYSLLRRQILAGEREPGTELSQARVAKQLGVSRGPVREAFRLLEREGLIEVAVNQRARVASLSVEDLEHLYALRVVNESLALSVSVPQFTFDELDELDELAVAVTDPRTSGFEDWDEEHQRFHTLLLTHSGDRMLSSAGLWAERTLRYRRVYVSDDNGPWTHGAREHEVLAQLCRDRDSQGAARLLALHLSRAALTLLSSMAPTHEPALLRAAIRQVVGAPSGLELTFPPRGMI